MCTCSALRPTPGNELRPLVTKTIKEVTTTGTACNGHCFDGLRGERSELFTEIGRNVEQVCTGIAH